LQRQPAVQTEEQGVLGSRLERLSPRERLRMQGCRAAKRGSARARRSMTGDAARCCAVFCFSQQLLLPIDSCRAIGSTPNGFQTTNHGSRSIRANRGNLNVYCQLERPTQHRMLTDTQGNTISRRSARPSARDMKRSTCTMRKHPCGGGAQLRMIVVAATAVP